MAKCSFGECSCKRLTQERAGEFLSAPYLCAKENLPFFFSFRRAQQVWHGTRQLSMISVENPLCIFAGACHSSGWSLHLRIFAGDFSSQNAVILWEPPRELQECVWRAGPTIVRRLNKTLPALQKGWKRESGQERKASLKEEFSGRMSRGHPGGHLGRRPGSKTSGRPSKPGGKTRIWLPELVWVLRT